jgi:hypothetical protein
MTVSRTLPETGEIERRTYVTCLNCGEEIAYNWDKMQTEGSFHAAPSPANVSLVRERAPIYTRLLPAADHRHLTSAQAGR